MRNGIKTIYKAMAIIGLVLLWVVTISYIYEVFAAEPYQEPEVSMVTSFIELEIEDDPISAPVYEIPIYEDVPNVPSDFKTYTEYTKLRKDYPQWTQIQAIAYTDENGLRKVDNYYCVAMASYYTDTVGDLFRIITEDGNVFEVIITDFKADRDTNPSTHQYTTLNYCIVEFYVDVDLLPRKTRRTGTISSIDGFSGRVIEIQRLGNYFKPI